MKNVAFQIKAETTDSFVFVAGIIDDNKCTLMLMLSDDLVKEGLHAGKIVKEAAKHIQGGGGGQPHFATAGGKNMEGLSIAVGAVKEAVGVHKIGSEEIDFSFGLMIDSFGSNKNSIRRNFFMSF